MKIKNILALLLALCMVFALVACGGGETENEEKDDPKETQGTNKPTNNQNAPVTADPMVIAAVVSAISACGVMIAKKRK